MELTFVERDLLKQMLTKASGKIGMVADINWENREHLGMVLVSLKDQDLIYLELIDDGNYRFEITDKGMMIATARPERTVKVDDLIDYLNAIVDGRNRARGCWVHKDWMIDAEDVIKDLEAIKNGWDDERMTAYAIHHLRD